MLNKIKEYYLAKSSVERSFFCTLTIVILLSIVWLVIISPYRMAITELKQRQDKLELVKNEYLSNKHLWQKNNSSSKAISKNVSLSRAISQATKSHKIVIQEAQSTETQFNLTIDRVDFTVFNKLLVMLKVQYAIYPQKLELESIPDEPGMVFVKQLILEKKSI